MSKLAEQVEQDIRAWEALSTVVATTPFALRFPAHHRTGTHGDRQTDRWLVSELKAAGLHPQTVTYPFERLDIEDCWVEADGERLPAVPMYDSAPVQMTIDGVLGDTIALLPCSPQEARPDTRAVLEARASGRFDAIIARSSAQTVTPGLALVNSESYRNPARTPVLQVTSHAPLNPDDNVTCHLSSTRVPAQATNIEVRIPGQSSDPAWVIMTPKSSWWTSTAERVGGIVCWLALARHFAEHPPRATVIFTANSGHELSHLGMDHFLSTLTAPVQGWLHLGANFASGAPPHLQASDPEHFTALAEALTTQGIEEFTCTPVGTTPVGEARNIHDLRQPYYSIVGANPCFHHPEDHYPDTIDLDRTVSIVSAFLALMKGKLI